MKIELLELALQNFQGATAVTFAPEGRNAEVRGDNGTGKTTLLNAWSWLLTGKDSAGRADFALKTLGPDGEPLHKLAHGVTARLQVNGEAVTISKTYSEKWTKKRGAPEAELTGHVNEYAVDGVPILEKEWKETIARIAPEATWRLVSSPGAFASLHWKEQRAVLLDLAGDLMDADVMASDPALAPLPGILGKRSPDDHRKAIVARRKVVAPQAEQIPARVDELLRQTQGAEKLNRAAIDARIAEIDEEIANAAAGSLAGELRKERSALLVSRADLDEKRARDKSEAVVGLRRRANAVSIDAGNAANDAASLLRQAERAEKDAAGHEAAAAKLREEFAAFSAVPAIEGICPTCSQALPAHVVAEATERSNTARADALRKIRELGKAAVAAAGQLRAEAESNRKQAEAAAEAEAEHRAVAVKREAEAKAVDAQPHPLDQEIADLGEMIASIDRRIAEANAGQVDTSAITAERKGLMDDLARLDAAAKAHARIGELGAEQKALAGEIEQIDRDLFLLDRFQMAQGTLLERRVNGMFGAVSFRLFRSLLSGGQEPCCDMLVDGVPYGSGLNRGAETNAGMDLIRVLGAHYGLSAPVWVDNSESVVKLSDCGSQTIKLIVDGVCPVLTVKVEE